MNPQGKGLSPERFRLGLNYWPSSSAMAFWRAFDREQLGLDFSTIAAAGFDSVRIFLTWEDFQPTPSHIEASSVSNLIAALDEAALAGLDVIPTLFTGHMSGVNWIPQWALANESSQRFRVVATGRVVPSGPANWYTNATVREAQMLLAGELARALSGHPALWAWDLGNENSNCSVPPSKAHGQRWLGCVSDAIRRADATVRITLGLHMEDLSEDRNLGPGEAAEFCDFLTMHGYPGYAPWTSGPTDERLLPFLARLTRWLGKGKDVLFTEFGVPTRVAGAVDPGSAEPGPALVAEAAAAAYVRRSLDALLACGCKGAMLWCFSDYAETLWRQPPFDLAVHERSFGLWRRERSAKPSVGVITAFAARNASPATEAALPDRAWLDIEAADYFRAPAVELPRLYERYCRALCDADRG